MKKAMLGRRLFASLIPAAPVMAGEIGRGVADKLVSTAEYSTPPSPFDLRGMNKVRKRFEPPATYGKYREAEEVLSRVRHFRYERNRIMYERQMMDPNITCLKSVSPQHKAIMQLKQRDQENERTHIFLEQLQDALGLREYFKKLQETYADSPEAATGGY